ncbi:uncharacterized protein METZ01_LOCUS509314, partial [marine metagenome]
GCFDGVCVPAGLGTAGGCVVSSSYNVGGWDISACDGNSSWVGDGYCDSNNNNQACGYDGGDCCEQTCVDGDYTCNSGAASGWGNIFDCNDPNVDANGGPQAGAPATGGGALADGDACVYDYLDETVAGQCFYNAGAGGTLCLPSCDVTAPNDSCPMVGAVCQPFGIIDDPATFALCVPSGCNDADGNAVSSACPAGTHGCVEGICVPPLGTPCDGVADGSACDFTYGDAAV